MESEDGIRRPWQDLVPELLSSICMRLDCIASYVTFACVCRQWRASAKAAAKEFATSKTPMLVHFSFGSGSDILVLYDLPKSKIYKKRIQGVRGLRYIGNSYGCLIMMDLQSQPVILNPFTGARIEIRIPPDDINVAEEFCMTGALSAPVTSPACHLFLVMRICTLWHQLGSRSSWTRFPIPSALSHMSFARVVITKDRVYALTIEGLITVMEIDPPTILFKMIPMPPGRLLDVTFPRIMNVSGQLWAFSLENEVKFESYRFEEEQNCWKKDEFGGDISLFLTVNGCEVYDTKNCTSKEIISGQNIYVVHKVYRNYTKYSLFVDKWPSPGLFQRIHDLWSAPDVAWLYSSQYYI